MRTIIALLVIGVVAGCSSPSPTPTPVPRDRLDVIVRNLSAAPAELTISAPGGSPSGANSTALACNLAAVSVGVVASWEVSVGGAPILASSNASVPDVGASERLEVRITVDVDGSAAVEAVQAIPFDSGVFNGGTALRDLMPAAADCAAQP